RAGVEHLVQRVHDALDPRVVGRDAVADQAIGRRQRLEEVDRDLAACLGDLAVEDVARVDAGGSGSDDRDAKGEGHRVVAFRCPVVELEVPLDELVETRSGPLISTGSINGEAYGLKVTTSPTTTTAGERMPRRAACSAIVSSVPTVTRWRGP